MKTELPELPPLWSDPPPMGHNGGPELRPRRAPGRPTVDTPEIRDRIFELLGDGVPLRVICRSPGMPSRRTVYNWRRDDPGFDRAFEFMQTEGYIGLAQKVMEEMETILEQRGPKIARWVFNLRRQQLSRMMKGPKWAPDKVSGVSCFHVACKRMWPCGTTILLP